MARIDPQTTILAPNTSADNIHEPVTKATYKIVIEPATGEAYLQIDTFGTNGRIVKDQPSQKLQIPLRSLIYMIRNLRINIDGFDPEKLKEICDEVEKNQELLRESGEE